MPLTIKTIGLGPKATRVNLFTAGFSCRAVVEVASLSRIVMRRDPTPELEIRPGSIYQVFTGLSCSLPLLYVRPRLTDFLDGLRVERVDHDANGELVLWISNLNAMPRVVGARRGLQFEIVSADGFDGDVADVEMPAPVQAPKVVEIGVHPPTGATRPGKTTELSDEEKQRRFMADTSGEATATVQAAAAVSLPLTKLAEKSRIGTMKADGSVDGGTSELPPPPSAPVP